MLGLTAYHQIGLFIVSFQNIEAQINDIIVLLVKADDEFIRITINELEYFKRLKTVEVLFTRFVEIRRGTDEALKTEFHELIGELRKLGERRNDIVHSKYMRWLNVEGKEGLIRMHSKLSGRQGTRDEIEENLLPEAFSADLKKLSIVSDKLEKFRLKIIYWDHPDELPQ